MYCVFCEFVKNKGYLLENELAFAVYDSFPVNKGHTLIIPKRHFESYFDALPEEILAMDDLVKKAKKFLDEEYKPDGYNIGVNVGADAGQGIFHMHIHLIPRYKGDVENPRGGIRKFKKPIMGKSWE